MYVTIWKKKIILLLQFHETLMVPKYCRLHFSGSKHYRLHAINTNSSSLGSSF